MTIEEHVKRLEAGWQWLNANATGPKHRRKEDVWIAWLREYEAAYREETGYD